MLGYTGVAKHSKVHTQLSLLSSYHLIGCLLNSCDNRYRQMKRIRYNSPTSD